MDSRGLSLAQSHQPSLFLDSRPIDMSCFPEEPSRRSICPRPSLKDPQSAEAIQKLGFMLWKT